jgi:exodeoxyribonuclease V alpha subunit
VLDLAVRYAPDECLTLEGVRRFADPSYATLSLRMRRGETPGEVFDELVARDQVVVHASDLERTHALAAKASLPDAPLVVADTREQVATLNGLVHQVRLATGEATDGIVTTAGERIGVGDRIATRHNDPNLDVANRETWTVTGCAPDGELTVTGAAGSRRLPAAYAQTCVELAYATTVYGAQGETVQACHVLVGDHTGAAAAYVGMTRGREQNVAHLVADTLDDARRQWVDVFNRDRADLGPAHAALRAAEDIERYGPKPSVRRRRVQPPRARGTENDFVSRPPAPAPSRGIGF